MLLDWPTAEWTAAYGAEADQLKYLPADTASTHGGRYVSDTISSVYVRLLRAWLRYS